VIDLDALKATWDKEFSECSDNENLDAMRNVVKGMLEAGELTAVEYKFVCQLGKTRREELNP
jgi:hypothetical protein